MDDECPLFRASPVTYYNSAYFGREFFLANHGPILLAMVLLPVARLRRRDEHREAGARWASPAGSILDGRFGTLGAVALERCPSWPKERDWKSRRRC